MIEILNDILGNEILLIGMIVFLVFIFLMGKKTAFPFKAGFNILIYGLIAVSFLLGTVINISFLQIYFEEIFTDFRFAYILNYIYLFILSAMLLFLVKKLIDSKELGILRLYATSFSLGVISNLIWGMIP